MSDSYNSFDNLQYCRYVSPEVLIGRQTNNEMIGSIIKKMKMVMKNTGYDFPPIDVGNVEGKLIILDGHHRVKAAKSLGIESIPIIETVITDKERADRLMIEAAETIAAFH